MSSYVIINETESKEEIKILNKNNEIDNNKVENKITGNNKNPNKREDIEIPTKNLT